MDITDLSNLYYDNYYDFRAKFKEMTQLILEGNYTINQINDLVQILTINIINSPRAEKGYIYCITSDLYTNFGENVYKIDYTNNIDMLIKYMGSANNIHFRIMQSNKVTNYNLAWRLLTYLLDDYICEPKVVLIDCPSEIIEKTFMDVEKMINNLTDDLQNNLSNQLNSIIDNDINKIIPL